MIWSRISLATRSSLLTRSMLLGQLLRSSPHQAKSYVTAIKGNGPPSATLYVENFSHTATDSDLKKVFCGCIDAEIILDSRTGQSKGYAFVEYPSVDEAKAVIDQPEDIVLDGRTLIVGFTETEVVKRGYDEPSSTLFVGNLTQATTEKALKEAFNGCKDARIVSRAVRNGKRKYFGFVEFSEVYEAKAVFDQQENVVLDGRTLIIGYGRLKADDATVRKGNRKPTSELFVGNLSPMTTETDLTKAFDGCINARIIRDTETGKCYGFVEYTSVDEAQAVFSQIGEITLDGYTLHIDYATSQVKRQSEPTVSSSLFVSNLSSVTTENDLMDAFDGCISAKIKLDTQTGKSKGFGYVKYSSVDEAKAVYDQPQDIVLDGRTLFIDYYSEQTQGNSGPSNTLFVKNLSPTTTKSSLVKVFNGCVNATVMTDPETGHNKGYGFVNYNSAEEAKAAFDQAKDIVLDGRTLYVNLKLPKTTTLRSAVRRKNNEPSNTLFVGSMSYKTTGGALMEAFSGCTRATIMVDSQGRSKGFGFVEYASVEEAKLVFDHPESIKLDGCVLFINYATNYRVRGAANEGSGEADLLEDVSIDDNEEPTSNEYEK